MIIAQLFSHQKTIAKLHGQTLIGHKNRKHNIDRNYEKSKRLLKV